MLRPQHRQYDSLDRLHTASERSTMQSPQSCVLSESSNLDSLIESLMPNDVSANKQAVIKRLITMWATKSELDVA